jgi:putative sterol carrier protein
MATKYLSEEWAKQFTDALNADATFGKETKKQQSVIAWSVSDVPGGGSLDYYLKVDRGSAEVRLGAPAQKPDLQLTCSYETLVQVATGTLSGREAFQKKKLRSDKKLIAILKHLGVFHEMNRVLAGLDVEY